MYTWKHAVVYIALCALYFMVDMVADNQSWQRTLTKSTTIVHLTLASVHATADMGQPWQTLVLAFSRSSACAHPRTLRSWEI